MVAGIVRFSRAGRAIEDAAGPGGRDDRAGREQPWPIAYPSGLVTVTHTSVRGLAAAAATRSRASAGSRRPKPWISPGRSARPRSVASGTIRSAGRRSRAGPVDGAPAGGWKPPGPDTPGH